MYIDTMRFSYLLEANHLYDLNWFLAQTAFVIAHKSESLETLLGVIWYLPTQSPVIIVSNCPETEKVQLKRDLAIRLGNYQRVYFIHQKDQAIARLFAAYDVPHILDVDGRVRNGKGEGMYIGTLAALLLDNLGWIAFYDADNFVPSALLEYTLAMSRLFMAERYGAPLHNVRICWSSKPEFGGGPIVPGVLGRCTRVVSPLLTTLIGDWFNIDDKVIISSNAGEQGLSMSAAQQLRFSSGYSIETFQLLELLRIARPCEGQYEPQRVILHQYQAQSPHFHEKRDEQHIKKMIEESLGCFSVFEKLLSPKMQEELRRSYDELQLELRPPIVYPSPRELLARGWHVNVKHYSVLDQFPVYDEQEAVCG